ncbi:unnamed protein product [Cercopithifilaria johnstoni]|uniref:RRM domain-containing protein n=1 Tax=Cercopithifilaria johnstoni TaxID=2874296 RepID=A0A8J2LR94_9BILA|nr:unnamed protein product [Cercopithifilaria johnstoni]
MATRLVRRSVAALKTFKRARQNGVELFVKRISWVTGASELMNHFSQFGKVRNITLPFDLTTGLHKGFAFILFENDGFYENIKKFEGKHIIDDEEVICSLADEGKPLLLADAHVILFGSENSSKMDISNANRGSEIGGVEFIKTETNIKGKEIKREANPKIISTNNMDFQDSKEQSKEANLLQKLQEIDDSKKKLGKNTQFEKTTITKLTDLVSENEGNNKMYMKTYTNMRPSNDLHGNVTRNGFSGGISSSNRSFRIPTIKTTNQKYLKKGLNSDQV